MPTPCDTIDTCIQQRRKPTEEEQLQTWADKDGCMNCKLGREREREIARQRPETPDTNCIMCYEPLPKRNGKYSVCFHCWAILFGKYRTKEVSSLEQALAEYREI